MDVSHILSPLNDAQRQAVTSDADRLLVLAGAGSGKTRVLVHRIGWVMATEDVSPYSILSVTFTNKAAAEMRHRIEDLLDIPASGMWVGTFHGIAHRLLRTHWQDAGLVENFQILDSDDQHRLIKRIMKEMGLDDTKWPSKQAQYYINQQKDEGLRPQHIEHHGDLYLSTMVQVYTEYEATCARGGMIDFNEMLLRAHELWLNNPRLLRHYQQRFRLILVDEFQDTNSVQYAWLRLLACDTNRITIVGDDDQSIYGWRGAKIENIQQFSKDFKGAETIRLEQNYRSTSTILTAANELIKNNQNRLGKELWTDGDEGEPISLFAAFNERDEADFIVQQTQHWLQQGRSRSDVAYLYRSNAQSRVLEDALIQAGIPYRIYGGQRFFERAEIKNALSYLRLIENRHSDAAFERIINTPTRGIGQKSIEAIREYGKSQQCSLWEASCQLVSGTALTARAATAIKQFLELISELAKATQELGLWEQTEHVIEVSGLIEHHQKEKGEKGQQRIENLQELVIATKQFDEDGYESERLASNGESVEVSALSAFLDHAALEAGEAQADQFEDSVQLMTLHSAKGLEFPVVFMSGVEEGLFPHKMSIDDPGGLEEERRLCYVGITRAMIKLHISYAESRRQWGAETFNTRPSRFISELPTECIEEVRTMAVTKPTSFAKKKNTPIAMGNSDYRLGQRVMHVKFGEGMVINSEGDGPNARIEVNFDSEGSKWLVSQYARLEIV